MFFVYSIVLVIEARSPCASRWDPTYGDRSQELVLIGVNLEKDKMRKALEEALLTDKEMGRNGKNIDQSRESRKSASVSEGAVIRAPFK